MKILHVEAGKHLYGGAKQVRFLVEGLTAAGHDNIVVCTEGSALAESWRGFADIIEIPITGELDMSLKPRLKQIIKQHKPDIAHAHSRRGADWWTGAAAKACGIPAVLSRRVDNAETRLGKIKYRHYDKVICISGAIAEVLKKAGVDENKIHIERSTVAFRPPSHEDPKALALHLLNHPRGTMAIGVIAQLIERKGHDVLFDALAGLKTPKPYVLYIFGQGPLENVLHEQVREKNVRNVKFMRFRADLLDLIPGLDLVIHPARTEGMGVALLEASAAGVPVIASRVGGIPEAIRDHQNGWLVEHNNPKALRSAILAAMQADELREEYGANGRRIMAEEFSVSRMVNGHIELYRSLINSRQSS